MTHSEAISALKAANEAAREAMQKGHHPFGAVLIAPDNKTVLLTAGNINTVRHAELEVAQAAYEAYEPEFLAQCTLATNFEPCVMCTGAIYWANIGRIVFGATESALLDLTGDHEENPTFSLPCRQVIAHGQKEIEVLGPYPEIEEEILRLHKGFWQ